MVGVDTQKGEGKRRRGEGRERRGEGKKRRGEGKKRRGEGRERRGGGRERRGKGRKGRGDRLDLSFSNIACPERQKSVGEIQIWIFGLLSFTYIFCHKIQFGFR